MFSDAVESIHTSLLEYIEANYHISDPSLLEHRRRLLDRTGVLRQPAFIESSKTYRTSEPLSAGLDRLLQAGALSDAARARIGRLCAELSEASGASPVLFDPPRAHVLRSLEEVIGARNDVVVFTGTGSGKTECFTLPILTRLAREAVDAPDSFRSLAVRALVVYPMNALVNDQLGRVRRLLGAPPTKSFFEQAAGRVARFGQYTGRTPFPGVRSFDGDGDGRRIGPFKSFYVDDLLGKALEGDAQKQTLVEALRQRNRWPEKDLIRWFDGARWKDRLHPNLEDPELVARHEFYGYEHQGQRVGGPPDVLITNYSMLEYMMMRPIERPIFDATRRWLRDNPEQRLFLILDEAHLYRGAQGTEVALLLRRLQERLALTGARNEQLQVIVTSASFSTAKAAKAFAAQLTGRESSRFTAIGDEGHLAIKEPTSGGQELAEALARVNAVELLTAPDEAARVAAAAPALEALGVASEVNDGSLATLGEVLYGALERHPLRERLAAETQAEARQITGLAPYIFEPMGGREGRALAALIALLVTARRGGQNLFPSRVHSFHRGLPGLWLCLRAGCDKLYAQPRERCDCGARALELYTCRDCGVAYARGAVTERELGRPSFVWPRPGDALTDEGTLLPADLLLPPPNPSQRPSPDLTEPAALDVVTGALSWRDGEPGEGERRVWLYAHSDADRRKREQDALPGRTFFRCGVCRGDASRGREEPRSSVQDHQTSGQEPFYTLINQQLAGQPPRPASARPKHLKEETPLQGRKVLVFSDGRQKAARLATELGKAGLRDLLRPLVVVGYARLKEERVAASLADAYPVTLVGAAAQRVSPRLTDEGSQAVVDEHLGVAREFVAEDYDRDLWDELKSHAAHAPVSLATSLELVLRDKHTGLQALALGRVKASPARQRRLLRLLRELSLGSLVEADKLLLTELWLSERYQRLGSNLHRQEQFEPSHWWLMGRGGGRTMVRAVTERVQSGGHRRFVDEWLPKLEAHFCEGEVLSASRLTVEVCDDLTGWWRCERCSHVQSARLEGAPLCARCDAQALNSLEQEEPRRVFEARKGAYRRLAEWARGQSSRDGALLSGVAVREHTAALSGRTEDAHTRAEKYELAFQDITIPGVDGLETPVDVLSCTTTMEVGIDIGDLSAVALRNMPPGRANYQQRAGRAGRRATGVATVVAYADQEGHNQRCFEEPRRMIKDPVPDPTLDLGNQVIAERHVLAFVLQSFLQSTLDAEADAGRAEADLFASLGTVDDFVSDGRLSLARLEAWLGEEGVQAELAAALRGWLPVELGDAREALAQSFGERCVAAVRRCVSEELEQVEAPEPAEGDAQAADEDVADVDPAQVTRADRYLLDRLLARGVLPKYAFPTDLVSFHVFKATNGLQAKPEDARDKLQYAPQRSLDVALSEYAPGRTMFLDGRAWQAGALYSPRKGAVQRALREPELRYLRVCEACPYQRVVDEREDAAGEPCPSCGDASFGAAAARPWVRPPGFAHRVTERPGTDPSADAFSQAGRAVLVAPSPPQAAWRAPAEGLSPAFHLTRSSEPESELLVSNLGPRNEGFSVCRSCGRAAAGDDEKAAQHRRPFPGPRGYSEPCEKPDPISVTLGTSFRTDVLLLRFAVPAGHELAPGGAAFKIAVRSLAEGLVGGATAVFELEADEVLAGHRRAFGPEGPLPDVEVFLYDRLAGGAGYVAGMADPARLDEVLEETRRLLEHDRQGGLVSDPCDRACYGCLLSFRNSRDHALFDRRLALDLLTMTQTGRPAALDADRQRVAYAALARGLRSMRLPGVEVLEGDDAVQAGAPPAAARLVVRQAGRLVVPALTHPFRPQVPSDPTLAGLIDADQGGPVILPLDHLVADRNPPVALARIKEALSD